MWKKKKALLLTCALLQNHPWRTLALRRSSSLSCAVKSSILRSLKDHFLDATKVSPPPRIKPPEPFVVAKGAMDGKAPALRRSYGDGEEITVSAERLTRIHGGGDGDEDDIGELFLHVEVSKAAANESLHFLCGLYPDALGIDAVYIGPKAGGPAASPTAYDGPAFRDIDEKMRDTFHKYIEERGVNESLFPFLQVWLYVNEHRKLVRWLKSVGTFIQDNKSSEEA